MTNIIILAALTGWSLFGVLFYLTIHDEIPNFWKKQLARIISGPLVWAFAFIGYAFIAFDWIADKNVGFTNWLKKP